VWTIVGLTVAIDATAVALGILDRSVQSLTATATFTAVTIGFASLGALIVSRQRGNAFGWLFITLAMFLSVPHNLLQNYAVMRSWSRPTRCWEGGKVAFWLSSQALDGMFILLMTRLLLLFPDGRPATVTSTR
jgi:ABC-type glycerol-3-phosphate transport system permease component